MKIFFILLVFLLQFITSPVKASFCINQRAQSISEKIENLNSAYTAYLKNLIKKNKSQFFKILQKRINLEKSSKENQKELLGIAFNSYFSSCEGSFVDCLKEIARGLPDRTDMAMELLSFVDKKNENCGALSLVTRRIVLKGVALESNEPGIIEDFFKAGYYTKISQLNLKNIIENPIALRYYSLSLAQLGMVQKIDAIIQTLESSTFDKSLVIELMFRKAVALRKIGKNVESIKIINDILENKASAKFAEWLYLEMATTYLILKRPDLAELSLQSSITINSSNDLLGAYQSIVASNTSLSLPITPEGLQNFDLFDLFAFCSRFLKSGEDSGKNKLQKICNYIVGL